MKEDQEVLDVKGMVIQGPDKVKVRSLGEVQGNTLKKGVLSALRHPKFLNITVIITPDGRRLLVAEVSKE